jgi:hypothetical protein
MAEGVSVDSCHFRLFHQSIRNSPRLVPTNRPANRPRIPAINSERERSTDNGSLTSSGSRSRGIEQFRLALDVKLRELLETSGANKLLVRSPGSRQVHAPGPLLQAIAPYDEKMLSAQWKFTRSEADLRCPVLLRFRTNPCAAANRRLGPMCGRLRVDKENLHVAGLVGAAMCSAFECGSHDRWP